MAANSFAEVHATHRGGIIRYLHRMTRDLPLAEDLAQETFIRVDRGLPGFRGDSKLTTWLYRIATNVYFDHYRKAGTVLREEAAEPGLDLSSCLDEPKLPDRLFEDSEMGACIREFVDSLSSEYRTVIILHDLQGLKNREIAEILNCSLDTVKIRVYRARQKLKLLLTENCELQLTDDVLQCDRKQPDDPPRS